MNVHSVAAKLPAAGARAPAVARRRAGRFAETPRVALARQGFSALCRVLPRLSARLAYAVLAHPPRCTEKPWQADLRRRAQKGSVRLGRGRIATLSWGAGPTVLLVHGWGAHATHMGRLVDPLVAAGHRVLAFDAPAHGESDGHSTDLVEYAAAIHAVAQQAGPLRALVAHSFGVAMSLYARRDWGVAASRQVLFSSFDHCDWFTDAFGDYLGLSAPVLARAREMMVERHNGRFDWERLSVADLLRDAAAPTLLVHDRDDPEVPFGHALTLLRAAPHAHFHATGGLGHHRLLGDPEVIRSVVGFVASAAGDTPGMEGAR